MATATLHANDTHAHGHDHEHEHHEPGFIRKYIFSEDHKTIAKQYLITGIIWAFFGGALSIIFRLQLGFPDMNLDWLKPVLGEWIVEGKLEKEFYLALVTMHGTIMVFFVLTAGLSGTFLKLLDSITDRCKRYGFRFLKHVVILVLLPFVCNYVCVSFH